MQLYSNSLAMSFKIQYNPSNLSYFSLLSWWFLWNLLNRLSFLEAALLFYNASLVVLFCCGPLIEHWSIKSQRYRLWNLYLPCWNPLISLWKSLMKLCRKPYKYLYKYPFSIIQNSIISFYHNLLMALFTSFFAALFRKQY